MRKSLSVLVTTALAAGAMAIAAPQANAAPVTYGTQKTILASTSGARPYGVVVDASGNVFVADPSNLQVLEVPAGGGTAAVLPFTGLRGSIAVAVDASGNVYVADADRVVELTPAGVQTTLPFTGLGSAFGLTVDASGNVYVADYNAQVVELTPGGVQTVLPFLGLSHPYGVALDASGNVYVADAGTSQVLELTPGGVQTVLPFTGLNYPEGVSLDAGGNVYVADAGNGRVLELAAGTGNTQTVVPFTGLGSSWSVVADASGDVYASDVTNNQVVELPVASAQAITGFTPTAAGTYGGTQTLTATGGGGTAPVVFSVDTTSDAGVCAVSGTNGATLTYTGPGTCVVDANQARDADYSAAPQVQASVTVDKAAQAITGFAPTTPGTYGGTQTLTATGGGGTAPVVFNVDTTSDAGVCAVSGTNGATLTYTGVGNCVVDANQAGEANYTAAPQSQASVTVNPSAQPITGFTPAATGTYGGTQHLSANGDGSASPVVFRVDPASTAGACATSGTNGSTLTYTGTGTCVIDANQAADGGHLASTSQRSVSIAKAVLTATVVNATRHYGAGNPVFKLGAFTGYVRGDTRTVVTGAAHLATTATRASRPGVYPITATVGTLAARNYRFVLHRGTLTVTRAGVHIKVAGLDDDALEGPNQARFTATVTSAVTGARLAGIRVTFTARTTTGRSLTCATYSDRYGVARCTAPSPWWAHRILARTYTAASTATGNFAAGHTTGAILFGTDE